MGTKWTALVAVVLVAGCSTGAGNDTITTTITVPSTNVPSVTTTPVAAPTTPSVAASTTTPTTTVPEPPLLEVTDPAPGAVATSKHYQFQGLTDPGCTVDVSGKYFATVNPDGAWTLELTLQPGDNSTTITATDAETEMTTSRAVQVSYDPPLTLRPDGLGKLDFATPEDEAVAYLFDMLGLPSTDEIDTTRDGPSGYERTLRWTSAGIEVVINDDAGYSPGGSPLDGLLDPPGLTRWRVVATTYGPWLETQEGIGVGSKAQAACAAYAHSCVGEHLGVEFRGDYWDWSIPSLGFVFDGAGTDPATQVIEASAIFRGSRVGDYESAIERLHYRARLVGTWRGTVTAPSTPPHDIELTFSQYRYRVTSLDDITTPPLHFGPNEPCDTAPGDETGSCGSWNVSDVLDNGDGEG